MIQCSNSEHHTGIPPIIKAIVRTHAECLRRKPTGPKTPSERLERFQHQFGHQLTKEGRTELEAIVKASLYWSGPGNPKTE